MSMSRSCGRLMLEPSDAGRGSSVAMAVARQCCWMASSSFIMVSLSDRDGVSVVVLPQHSVAGRGTCSAGACRRLSSSLETVCREKGRVGNLERGNEPGEELANEPGEYPWLWCCGSGPAAVMCVSLRLGASARPDADRWKAGRLTRSAGDTHGWQRTTVAATSDSESKKCCPVEVEFASQRDVVCASALNVFDNAVKGAPPHASPAQLLEGREGGVRDGPAGHQPFDVISDQAQIKRWRLLAPRTHQCCCENVSHL
eukprot:1184548-Prorocentrum_minimum.AAC.3